MNGKENFYTLIVCQEGGIPTFLDTKTDEDLVEKYIANRENKYTYFQWNKGCIPMRNLIGVASR